MKTQKTQYIFIAILFSLAFVIPSNIWAQHAQKKNSKDYQHKQKPNKNHVATIDIKGSKKNKKHYHTASKHYYRYSPPKKHYKPQKNHYRPQKQYSTVYQCLPKKAHLVYLNGRKYYHYSNRYYTQSALGGFVMVLPPKYVNRLPQGAVRGNYQGHNVYKHGAIYLSWTPYGYVIL